MGERACNPVVVEVTRGGFTESRHRGALAVVAGGRVVEARGDVAAPVLARSAVKPLQALAMVESGAADAFALSETELALACASHGGEPRHVSAVAAWLARLGLGEADLICAGETAERLRDNCSGKHAAMLTLARHLGAPVAGYGRPDHPVQVRIRALLGEMCGHDLGPEDGATDGCGVPTFALPLAALALGVARFAAPDDLAPARAGGARRLAAAMAAAPGMVAGHGRFDTAVIAATGGRVLVKAGAEGVHVAALPDRGLGIALKIDDGARRAAETAMAATLDRLGAFDAGARRALAGWLAPPVSTRAGAAVGEVRAVAARDSDC